MNIPSFIYVNEIMYEVKGTSEESLELSVQDLLNKFDGEKVFQKDGQLYIVNEVLDAKFEDILEQKIIENKIKEKHGNTTTTKS